MTSTPQREAAQRYNSYGWAVVPMPPGSKGPYVRWAELSYEDTTDQLDGWWDEWPHARVGILTGHRSDGLVVIDADTDDPAFDGDQLSELTEPTRWATTPGGGFHLYYQSEDTYKSAGRVMPGVDVRADGGLVVAPPDFGRTWREEGDPAPLPPGMAERLAESNPGRRRHAPSYIPTSPHALQLWMESSGDAVAQAPRGERNNELNRQTYKLGWAVARGVVDEHEVRDAMYEAARRAELDSDPDCGPRGIQATIESALRAATRGDDV